jgi:hypothetical protein
MWDTAKGLRIMDVEYVPGYSQAAFACMVGPDADCIDLCTSILLEKRRIAKGGRLIGHEELYHKKETTCNLCGC